MFLRRSDFSRAATLTVEFTRELPLTLGVLFLLSFAGIRYFEGVAVELATSEQGPWMAQMGQAVVSMTEGFAVLLIGGYFLMCRHEKITWREFFRRTIAPLTAESLRALTLILLWSLALLIPGFIMYCRLSLIPFIVFCDPTYSTRPDAIARSMELTKRCWPRLFLFMLALAVVSAVFELAPHMLMIDDLITRIMFDFSGFLFSLFGFMLLYIIFENLRDSHDAKES